jgi:hypothetical protein
MNAADPPGRSPVKRFLAWCAAMIVLAGASPASAQVYGQMTGAVPIGVDQRLFGLYGGFSSHQNDLLGQLRLSFYPGLDFGFQGGISHLRTAGHTRTVVQMGGDLKTLVARRSETFPLDLALGGTVGVGSADNFNLLSVGPLVVASVTRELRGGAALVPYGGAALLYTRSDIGSQSSTDASLHLRAGVEVQPNPDVRFVMELQAPLSDPVDRHAKLLLGANFPF